MVQRSLLHHKLSTNEHKFLHVQYLDVSYLKTPLQILLSAPSLVDWRHPLTSVTPWNPSNTAATVSPDTFLFYADYQNRNKLFGSKNTNSILSSEYVRKTNSTEIIVSRFATQIYHILSLWLGKNPSWFETPWCIETLSLPKFSVEFITHHFTVLVSEQVPWRQMKMYLSLGFSC